MKRHLAQLGFALAILLVAGSSFAGEVLDRIVATVENAPILQSDWDKAVALEALEDGTRIESFTAEERRQVLDRLIDQELLREQMGDDSIAEAADREIDKQLEKIRAEYPQAKTEDDWKALLARYGLDEQYLREKVARQLQVMHFVDLRLRPEAGIDRETVETYYTQTLVPEVQKRGERAENLAKVYPKIEEILRQQRIDELLGSWLQDLRAHTEIHWMEPPTPEAAPVANAEGH